MCREKALRVQINCQLLEWILSPSWCKQRLDLGYCRSCVGDFFFFEKLQHKSAEFRAFIFHNFTQHFENYTSTHFLKRFQWTHFRQLISVTRLRVLEWQNLFKQKMQYKSSKSQNTLSTSFYMLHATACWKRQRNKFIVHNKKNTAREHKIASRRHPHNKNSVEIEGYYKIQF